MVIDQTNFLDLYDIWVNELVGDVWLFIFIGIILIWFLSAKSKISLQISFIFLIIFLSAVFVKTGMIILWVFTVLGVGTLFYFKLQKIIRQG